MIWIYQNADCSLRKYFIVSFIIIFGTLSFPIAKTVLWRRCDVFCTSGFTDDVKFSLDGQECAYAQRYSREGSTDSIPMRITRLTHQWQHCIGAESAVYDYCLLLIIHCDCSRSPLHFYRAMLCIRGTSHGPVSVSLCVCYKSEFY